MYSKPPFIGSNNRPIGEKQIYSSFVCALQKLSFAKYCGWIWTDTFRISQLKNNWEAEQVLIIPQLNWERQQEKHLWMFFFVCLFFLIFRYKKFLESEPYEMCLCGKHIVSYLQGTVSLLPLTFWTFLSEKDLFCWAALAGSLLQELPAGMLQACFDLRFLLYPVRQSTLQQMLKI